MNKTYISVEIKKAENGWILDLDGRDIIAKDTDEALNIIRLSIDLLKLNK